MSKVQMTVARGFNKIVALDAKCVQHWKIITSTDQYMFEKIYIYI